MLACLVVREIAAVAACAVVKPGNERLDPTPAFCRQIEGPGIDLVRNGGEARLQFIAMCLAHGDAQSPRWSAGWLIDWAWHHDLGDSW